MVPGRSVQVPDREVPLSPGQYQCPECQDGPSRPVALREVGRERQSHVLILPKRFSPLDETLRSRRYRFGSCCD